MLVYLYVSSTWNVLQVGRGPNLRFGLLLEVQLDRLNLFVATFGLVRRILQRPYSRLGVPLQLGALYL